MKTFLGNSIFVRTITYHYIGRLAEITEEGDLMLQEASWVADSGRWNQALTTGSLSEVEPYPDPVLVRRDAIVDVTGWRHELPTAVK